MIMAININNHWLQLFHHHQVTTQIVLPQWLLFNIGHALLPINLSTQQHAYPPTSFLPAITAHHYHHHQSSPIHHHYHQSTTNHQ